jgi:hypothetical protein
MPTCSHSPYERLNAQEGTWATLAFDKFRACLELTETAMEIAGIPFALSLAKRSALRTR